MKKYEKEKGIKRIEKVRKQREREDKREGSEGRKEKGIEIRMWNKGKKDQIKDLQKKEIMEDEM